MSSNDPQRKEPADVPASFEAALASLESIVADMEGGKLSLDSCLARHAEGSRLAAFCEKKLADAERKIEILAKSGSDSAEWRAFETPTDDEA